MKDNLFFNDYFLNNEITRVEKVGKQSFPSGKIVCLDPLLGSDPKEYTKTIPKGEYEVEVSFFDNTICASRLVINDHTPVRYEMTLCEGEDLSSLGEDDYLCFPIDTGLACFIDKEEIPQWNTFVKSIEGHELLEGKDYYRNVSYYDKTINIFRSGYGDGSYPSFFGYDEKDEICCVVIIFIGIPEIKEKIEAKNELKLEDTSYRLVREGYNFYIKKENGNIKEIYLECAFRKNLNDLREDDAILTIMPIEVNSRIPKELEGKTFTFDKKKEIEKRDDTFYLKEKKPITKYTLEIVEVKERLIHIRIKDAMILDQGKEVPLEVDCVLNILNGNFKPKPKKKSIIPSIVCGFLIFVFGNTLFYMINHNEINAIFIIIGLLFILLLYVEIALLAIYFGKK